MSSISKVIEHEQIKHESNKKLQGARKQSNVHTIAIHAPTIDLHEQHICHKPIPRAQNSNTCTTIDLYEQYLCHKVIPPAQNNNTCTTIDLYYLTNVHHDPDVRN